MASNKKSKNNGYSLLELIVVVAILSVVLGISTPSIRTYFYSLEEKELREIKRDLAAARNSAIIERKSFLFAVNINNNSYYIADQDKVTTIKKNVNLKSGLKLKSNNFSNILKFTPSGAPANGGSLVLSDSKGREIKLTITPATGKINVYK